ncbi:hypothetical protein LX32DRAFT_400669 [Colletotrichum zoysiae]|uniref:Uncharacterized protein n=1 Tax=Colletotrichum zoysiae TaxID=1216348 RepID=A0AAD9M4U0_9PEZI|nr:hypothetical protein LX32DRAFT_400669 [Colletotrichum zoysiae]
MGRRQSTAPVYILPVANAVGWWHRGHSTTMRPENPTVAVKSMIGRVNKKLFRYWLLCRLGNPGGGTQLVSEWPSARWRRSAKDHGSATYGAKLRRRLVMSTGPSSTHRCAGAYSNIKKSYAQYRYEAVSNWTDTLPTTVLLAQHRTPLRKAPSAFS